MTSPVDIRPDHLEIVQGILREHLPVDVKVWVFGSRANWTTKDSSDLDLAIEGKGKLNHKVLGALKDAFEDSALPYTVDVVDLHRIGHSFRQIVESQRTPLFISAGGTRWQVGLADDPSAETATGRAGPTTTSIQQHESPFAQFLVEPVRNGIYKKKEYHGRGVKIVNMGELFANPRLRDVHMRRVELSELEQHRFSVQAGDLLFARRSLVAEGAGKCSVVLEINEPTTFESSIIRARPDPTKADSLFLYYYFNSPVGLHSLDTIRRQVAVAGITGTDLAQLPLDVPPLPEQRAIAHVLGTLDDNIELNRRMNETLEEMARALFRSWFVDFDPVRAKMAGRWRSGESLPGLPADLYDLFPDRLVPSELGDIPEGWDVGVLGDVLQQRIERCLPSAYTEAVPYVPIDCIAARSLLLTSSKCGLEAKSSLTRFHKGDLLFGAMRPYFHKVCIAPFAGTTRTTVFVLHPRNRYDFSFGTLLLHSPDTIDFATRNSTGSTIPYAVWPESLAQMPTVIAPVSIRMAFDKITAPTLQRIPESYFEIRALTALRDILLPNLFSRNIRVQPDAV